jgi:hypothetical protein
MGPTLTTKEVRLNAINISECEACSGFGYKVAMYHQNGSITKEYCLDCCKTGAVAIPLTEFYGLGMEYGR